MRLWRLTHAHWGDRALSGEGARLVGGRWNPPGTPVVYMSSSLALAVLEQLVHADVRTLPWNQVAIPIEVPDDVPTQLVAARSLPRGWDQVEAPPALREIGGAWAAAGRTLLLRVPSAVIPQEENVLLNPAHPLVRAVVPGSPQPFRLDPRLLPGR